MHLVPLSREVRGDAYCSSPYMTLLPPGEHALPLPDYTVSVNGAFPMVGEYSLNVICFKGCL